MLNAGNGCGFTIAYGAIDDPAAAVAHGRQALVKAAGCLTPNLALVAPGDAALRFNTPGWLKLRPQMASELASHEDRVALCERSLAKATPLFARPVQTFVSNYIGFIKSLVDRSREELDEKSAAAGLPQDDAVLTYRDWTFSAFLPLPNAYIALDGSSIGAAGSFAHVDCAFWTGRTLLVVLLETLTMPLARQRHALARLAETRSDLEIIGVSTAPPGDLSAFAGLLGRRLSSFTDDCVLPYGLYRLPDFAQALPTED